MSGGGGTTQTVQKSDPWSGVQPYLVGSGGNGQPQFISQYTPSQGVQGEGVYIPAGYQQVPNPAYQADSGTGLYGRVDALSRQGQNPFVSQSQNTIASRALDPNSIYGQTSKTLGDTVSGKYLDPNSNPYFMQGLNDSLGLAKSQIAGQYGGFGGSNLLNSGYQENLARGLGGVAANAYGNLYSQERQNQMNALSQVPALGSLDATMLGQVGQQKQDFDWQQLQRANQIFSGAQGGTTTGQTPYTDNSAAQMAGLALMAYGAFGASDRRLKTNIQRIGTHKLGIGLYKYNIFDREEIGVMADEVMDVMPEAVVTMPNGYMGVRYDMIGGRDAV